jgi:phenylalanyl-tRNA synthetase beta chain
MIISVNWLKKYTDIAVPIDELTTLIGERLVEIEEVISLSEKYKNVVIVKVVDCTPVEDSDHLNLTKVDDGGVWSDVERDDNGYVQVVCGAPNVHAGMLAAWLPPRSTVPETFSDAEPFVLGARKLRGHMSNGMLASAKELDLYDDHRGIIEVDKDVAPGSSFAEVYELNDYLLDIENKSLTHRPDTFGVIGFAREVAGIQGIPFKTPDWLRQLESTTSVEGEVSEAPRVIIEDPALSDRFSAIVLSGAIESAESPLEIQTYLSRSGMRPISAIVDVTNYLMLLTGQPLHAYDYDKFLQVSGGVNEVHVRKARAGETLALLDGRTLELTEADTVIAAGDRAVGLAGAMGGAETEIDGSTQRILLECATFNLFDLRAVQMRHGIFSEAITRLTKGVPAPLGIPVLNQAAMMLGELASARASSVVAEDYPGKHEPILVSLTLDKINNLLGTSLSADDCIATLNQVEFSVDKDGDQLTVHVPYWRHDVRIAEDVIEEIGRLRGFDTIAPTLPLRTFSAVEPVAFDKLRARLRRILVRAGANEVLTYSFVHGDTMRKVGQEVTDAYRITNSISPELQYYRQSITPSLLSAIHPNVKAGFDHFAVFELNKFHTKLHDLNEESVPKELDSLGFVVARRSKIGQSTAFYEAKQYLEYVAKTLGITFVYEQLEEDAHYPVTQPFEPKRSARVWNHDKTVRVGVIGEYKRSVVKNFKLPDYSAGFEISPRAILQLVSATTSDYTADSRYPAIERDVCFQVSSDTSYAQLLTAATVDAEESLDISLQPIDLYQPEQGNTKNITLRFKLEAKDRTLVGSEASAYIDRVITAVHEKIGGTVV